MTYLLRVTDGNGKGKYFERLTKLGVQPFEHSRIYKELLRLTYLVSKLDEDGQYSDSKLPPSILTAARSLGLTPEEYLLRRSRGWRRCPKCREFKSESAFRTLTGPCSCAAHYWS